MINRLIEPVNQAHSMPMNRIANACAKRQRHGRMEQCLVSKTPPAKVHDDSVLLKEIDHASTIPFSTNNSTSWVKRIYQPSFRPENVPINRQNAIGRSTRAPMAFFLKIPCSVAGFDLFQ